MEMHRRSPIRMLALGLALAGCANNENAGSVDAGGTGGTHHDMAGCAESLVFVSQQVQNLAPSSMADLTVRLQDCHAKGVGSTTVHYAIQGNAMGSSLSALSTA